MDRWRRLAFHARGVIPVPFLVGLLIFAEPNSNRLLIGLLLLAAGEAVRLWAAGYISAYRVDQHAQGESLTTAGPYRYSRNPLYVGNAIMGLAYAAAAGGGGWIVMVLGLLWLQYVWLIVPHEETFLEERFGSRYHAYKAQVPRWFGLRPASRQPGPAAGTTSKDILQAVPGSEAAIHDKPDREPTWQWQAAWHGEIPTMLLHLFAYNLFLLHLDPPLWWPAGSALVIWLGWSVWISRRLSADQAH